MNFVNRPLVTIALIAIAGLLGFFWVWPQYQKFVQSEGQVESQTVALQNRELYLAEIRETHKNLEEHQGKMAQVNSALPDEISLPLLYSKMQSLAAESGGVLGSISVDQSSAKGGSELKPISVSFSFTGSYADIQEFVESIHASSRFLEITSIQFSSGEAEGGQFEFQVAAQAYSY